MDGESGRFINLISHFIELRFAEGGKKKIDCATRPDRASRRRRKRRFADVGEVGTNRPRPETVLNLHFKESRGFGSASEAYPEGTPDAKGDSSRLRGEKIPGTGKIAGSNSEQQSRETLLLQF